MTMRIIAKQHRRHWLWAVLLAGTCAMSTPSAAQRQPLVMTHGIRSGAETWDGAAFDLSVAFPVSVRRFTTEWKDSYATQANQLLSTVFAGQPDTTLAVGHSNGGLVLRQAAMLNMPMRGIATVGSPNDGAPAADAIRRNYMRDVVSPILIHGQWILDAFSPADFGDSNEQWYLDYTIATGSNMADLVSSILTFAGFDPAYDIWNSMYPSSPFMQQINSSSSLALQAARAPVRASIRTYLTDEDDAFWRLAIKQENVPAFEAIRDFATIIALEAGFYFTDKYCYTEPYHNGKCNASWLFGQLAYDMQLIEGRYCYKMTFENAAGPIPFPCFATDAVVPFERQLWPDTGVVQYEIEGPSHTEQPKSPGVRLAIERFLRNQANVERCGQGPIYQAQITAQSGDLLVGTTTPLAVTAYDRCITIPLAPPAINSVASSDPSVATVSAGAGLVNVTAIGDGVATITATMNGVTASRLVSIGAGNSLTVEISGGPRENLSTGETIWLYANPTPSGQSVAYEWRVDGGGVVSTSSAYGHYFQGSATVTLTATNNLGQTAYASAYLASGGNQLRIQRVAPTTRERP